VKRLRKLGIVVKFADNADGKNIKDSSVRESVLPTLEPDLAAYNSRPKTKILKQTIVLVNTLHH
jgi:hypothetical protein